MRYYALLVIALLFASSCEDEKDNITDEGIYDKMEQNYLQDIFFYGITEAYQDFKWRMYCNYCDVPVKSCRGREMKDLTYAMLDLKVFFLRFDNDTGEIAYTFLLNDSLQCTVENTDGSSVHGFGFKKDSAVPLYYIGAGKDGKISTRCDTLLYEEGYCPTRIIKPLQPDVIKYIRKNRAKLNPWFHMEAVRRGVFDE